MVLGGPGVGKSTFLRKMGLEALRRQAIMTNAQNNLAALKPQEQCYTHDCIPVMLTLQKFKSQDRTIKDVIAQEFEDCGFPQAQTFTELFLQSGKLLVLLDGLDEVPTETLNHVITEIETWSTAMTTIGLLPLVGLQLTPLAASSALMMWRWPRLKMSRLNALSTNGSRSPVILKPKPLSTVGNC
ncbi:MAG: NACHT domain-containing protein [Cyanobacteria bacterium P01_H01_bin.58]